MRRWQMRTVALFPGSPRSIRCWPSRTADRGHPNDAPRSSRGLRCSTGPSAHSDRRAESRIARSGCWSSAQDPRPHQRGHARAASKLWLDLWYQVINLQGADTFIPDSSW